MPLQFGKIGAMIAILTIGAFLLWLMFGSLLTGETAEEPIEPASLQSPASASALALAPAGPTALSA